MKRVIATVFFVLLSLCASAQEIPSFVKADSAALRFPGSRERFGRFASRLKRLKECPDSCVTIWHVGGSHVQAGWFPSRVRHNFDSLGHYPAGDRGYIFPYPLAKTNWDHSFSASREGEWEGSRCVRPCACGWGGSPVPPPRDPDLRFSLRASFGAERVRSSV